MAFSFVDQSNRLIESLEQMRKTLNSIDWEEYANRAADAAVKEKYPGFQRMSNDSDKSDCNED
jgi:hypothetical protein